MSVPRMPFCKSGQREFYEGDNSTWKSPWCRWSSVHTARPVIVAAPVPLQRCFLFPGVHPLTLQRRPLARRQWRWYFLSPSQWFPSLLLWAKAQFASNSGTGSFFFPTPVRRAAQLCGEMSPPGCFKAQPVSSLEGLAIHSLRIVLQATMGCMGARSFVIGSVVNSCWGNKSVTHLWLWGDRLFFFLLSSRSSPLRHCPWQRWPHQKS